LGIKPEQFEMIYLIHHNPEWNNMDFCRIEERIKDINVTLAYDGMEIEI